MKNQNIWDRRIPNVVGLFLIVIGIGITSYLVQNGIIFGGNAQQTEEPQDVRISNITDTSATISYTTGNSTIGALIMGDSKTLSQTIFDDRDNGSLKPHLLHIFTIKTLAPQSPYYFAITSGNSKFYANTQNTPYTLTTAPSLPASNSAQTSLTGKIVLPNGKIPSEGIIYFQPKNAQLLSALVDSEGKYSVRLDSLRDSTLAQRVTVSLGLSVDITAEGDNLTSHATYSFEPTFTVPPITLSSNYDFLLPSFNDQPVSSDSGNTAFPSFLSNPSASSSALQIISPKNGEGLTDQMPTFTGIALPNQRVDIVIHSDLNLQTHITANSDGSWSYRPTIPLPPGNHTITITSVDNLGVLKTIILPFTVFAAGSQIFNVLPTVTITPTNSPTPTITANPTQPATPTPTKIAPTPTPTIAIPTATQTPTMTPMPTPTFTPINTPTSIPTRRGLPKTGNESAFVLGIISIFITALGVVLFILTTKGNI